MEKYIKSCIEGKLSSLHEGRVKIHCYYFLSRILVTLSRPNWGRLSVRLLRIRTKKKAARTISSVAVYVSINIKLKIQGVTGKFQDCASKSRTGFEI